MRRYILNFAGSKPIAVVRVFGLIGVFIAVHGADFGQIVVLMLSLLRIGGCLLGFRQGVGSLELIWGS